MNPPGLEPHHKAAAERFASLIERAALTPRVTLRYEPTPVARGGGPGLSVTETGGAARSELNRLLARLPRDCAAVLVDLYLYGKGLQQIETERGWPRRSAKLVARIALDALANAFGFSPHAQGPARGRTQGALMTARPPLEV